MSLVEIHSLDKTNPCDRQNEYSASSNITEYSLPNLMHLSPLQIIPVLLATSLLSLPAFGSATHLAALFLQGHEVE